MLEDGIQEKFSATITIEYKIHDGGNLPISHLPVFQPAPQATDAQNELEKMQLRWETMLNDWEAAMSRLVQITSENALETQTTTPTKTTTTRKTTTSTTEPPPYEIPYCNLQKELDRYCENMSRFGDGDFNCPKAEGFEGKMVARFGRNKAGKQV